MNFGKRLIALLAVMTLGGCAHNLVISPDLGKLDAAPADQTIKKNVGYYIADATREKEVTTPGGGGDKVSYKPYRDIEIGLYKMLSNVFAGVTKLSREDDKDAIAKNKIDYIVKTELVTNSSSPSPFTWPPTQFSVEMTCSFSDINGTVLFSRKVTGQGHAEFAEFKKDFSLTGKLAAGDALTQMQSALLAAPELRH